MQEGGAGGLQCNFTYWIFMLLDPHSTTLLWSTTPHSDLAQQRGCGGNRSLNPLHIVYIQLQGHLAKGALTVSLGKEDSSHRVFGGLFNKLTDNTGVTVTAQRKLWSEECFVLGNIVHTLCNADSASEKYATWSLPFLSLVVNSCTPTLPPHDCGTRGRSEPAPAASDAFETACTGVSSVSWERGGTHVGKSMKISLCAFGKVHVRCSAVLVRTQGDGVVGVVVSCWMVERKYSNHCYISICRYPSIQR